MITIESLVEQGANVKLEVTPTDLKMFAESIVQRTIMAQQEEQRAAMLREAEETYLNTKQVRELLNVCEGTLNLWAKRGYLVPVKVGNKNMYAKSDVRRVQTGTVQPNPYGGGAYRRNRIPSGCISTGRTVHYARHGQIREL